MQGINPLSSSEIPADLRPMLENAARQFGFIPNSALTMARNPGIFRAHYEFSRAMNDAFTISPELRRLMFHVASHAAGCRYCQAHSISSLAHRFAVSEEKLAAIWEYETSPLFTSAERAALRFAQASASVPNTVTPADYDELRKFFSDDDILQMVASLAMGAFLNRWNDTLGTELEDHARNDAERILGPKGWTVGKHAR